MDRNKFTGDKRNIVLKAIQRIDPMFKPVYTPPELMYNDKHLNALNKNIQPIDQKDFPVMF